MRHSTPDNSRNRIGAAAEHAAELWLQAQGLTTVARNWRCKSGEIDRIMWHRDTLVFVEVRCRSRSDFGGAGGSVTIAKQRRIARAAQVFLLQHPSLQRHPCRFDVLLGNAAETDAWNWIRNAFTASY
jgi:putative endonuclease